MGKVAFPMLSQHLPLGSEEHVFAVPYDRESKRVENGHHRMTLDLRDNAEVMVAVGTNKGQRGIVLGRNADGHYRIAITHNDKGNWNEVRLLGKWWPAAAVSGEVQQIPLISAAAADIAASAA